MTFGDTAEIAFVLGLIENATHKHDDDNLKLKE